MESENKQFVVSARKYRPATFDTVVGQSHITTTLKNAIKNHQLAQAFLFCGPRGVGKTTCARILAKTINCTNLTTDGEACGKCESCLNFQKNSSFNVFELDAASNNSVDDMRNLVDQVRYPPTGGSKKVYIVDEVHMLSNAAFNAFLKTLEEPPEYVVFILATTEKHKIIPTILSRCQIFEFKRIEIQDMSEHLAGIAKKENIEAETDALDLIARKADGGLRDALSLFDLISTFSDRKITYQNTIANLHILDYDYYFKITEALMAEKMPDCMLLFDEILRKGFDGHLFISGLAEHLRNLMICKDISTVRLLEVSEKTKLKYTEQAQNASVSFLLSAMNLANECDFNYKSSKNQRFHVELALMKIASLNRAIHLASGQFSQQEELKKKVDTLKPIAENLPKDNKSGYESKNTATVSLQKTVSLNKNQNPKTTEENSNQVVVAKIEEAIPLDNKPFQLDDLEKYWQEFASIQESSNRFIFQNEYTLTENQVTLFLENKNIEDKFNLLKNQFIAFLKSKLQNDLISIRVEIIKQEIKPLAYTPNQKFNELLEKHPQLKELQDRLGLDVKI